MAVFVQALRDAHGAGRGEVQFRTGGLLQRRGHKRRVGPAGVRLGHHVGDFHVLAGQGFREGAGVLLVDHHELIVFEFSAVVEVFALGDAGAVDKRELGVEGLAGALERCGEVPVCSGNERHALAFALDDDARGHGLDTAGGQARHDLFPQHGADLVAVEAVEDAAGFLRVDEVHVQLARVFRGFLDRGFGDLVEHHALDGHLRLEHLEQVPRNRLALAVRVCREQQLVGLLQLGFKVRDLLLFVGADHVNRLEFRLRVHAELRPRFLLVLRGNVRRAAGKIADVAHRRLDEIAVAQVLLDLLRFRLRLHNHQGLALSVLLSHAA